MTADRTWTDLDLERFHDGDLPDADRDALAGDLRRDSRLRERLAGVIALDAQVRSALLGEAPARSPRLTLRGPILFGSIAAVAAASLALAFAASIMLGSRRAEVPPQIAAAPPAPDQEQIVRDAFRNAREYGIRLTVREAPAAEPAQPVPDPTREAMLAMLDRGDFDGALLAMRADATPDRALWQAVGERIRSGLAAEEILAALAPEEQIAVCRAWVERPSLRPVTFAWLARLGASTDPAVRAAVTDLRNDLAQQPDLRPWLRSYASR